MITEYANIATSKYMIACESRYLIVLKGDRLHQVAELMSIAERHKLTLGKIRLAGKASSEVGVAVGDVIVEVTRISSESTDSFVEELENRIPSAYATKVNAEDVKVCLCLYLFFYILAYLFSTTDFFQRRSAANCDRKLHLVSDQTAYYKRQTSGWVVANHIAKRL